MDSDFQADSFPLLQGAWPEAQGWALPLPEASKQGTWPAVPESHFITSLFSPGPSSWSSCWVAWCPLGSGDWLGITTRPCLWGWTVVWGQPALPPWAHQRPFLLWVSVFTHPQMGALGGWLSGSHSASWALSSEPAGHHRQLPQPRSGLEGEGPAKASGPPSRLPEGWEMSRQGNENLLLIRA